MIELGRVNIATEVSLLLSHLCLPREGHLHAALYLYGYLKWNHNACLVLGHRYPGIDGDKFPEYDWLHIYGHGKESVPGNAPGVRVSQLT